MSLLIKDKLDSNPFGLYKISEEVYFSQSQVSNSDLSHLMISPRKYKYHKDFGFKLDTPSLTLGKLVHCLYLEPDTFDAEFAVWPQIDKRTKIGKDLARQFLKSSVGKILIDEDTFDKGQEISARLKKQSGAIEEIVNCEGHPEVSAFCELNGVEVRGRLDYLCEDGSIYDVKTTKSLVDFDKSIVNYGYIRQKAMYSAMISRITGIKNAPFKFIVVETLPPYDSAVLELDEEASEIGTREVAKLLGILKDCISENKWPGAWDTSRNGATLSVPRWYRSRVL